MNLLFPSMPRSESSHNFSDALTEAEKRYIAKLEETMGRFARFPVIGQIGIWIHDFYLDNIIIPNPESSIYYKIGLRKLSIRILECCQLNGVIQSIFLTIIWGTSTYLDTGSTHEAYKAMGLKISAFYTLMTLPTFLLCTYNKMKLKVETAIRDEYKKQNNPNDVIAEEGEDGEVGEVDPENID